MLAEKAIIFKQLYNEWFEQTTIDYNYFVNKYFHDIKFAFEYDINSLKKYDKEVQIGFIIAYDQLSKPFCEKHNIDDISYSQIYSRIAEKMSITFLHDDSYKYYDLNVQDWYYILMPFVHLDSKSNLKTGLEIMKLMYHNPYISQKDKNICKKFISDVGKPEKVCCFS
jgi:hypothetical protein